MPRVVNYTGVLNRAEEITIELMKDRGILGNRQAAGADVLPLMPEVNKRIHAEFPEFATGSIRAGIVNPLPYAGGLRWRIELEALDGGVVQQAFGLDYDMPD